MLSDANVWGRLQLAALNDLHPDWLPELAAELVLAARNTLHGRNWLAGQLAIRSVLFGYLNVPDATGAPREPDPPHAAALPAVPAWLFEPLTDWQDRVLDLAATVSLPQIRATVRREQVLALRSALGEARYAQYLQREPVSEHADVAPGEPLPAIIAPVWPADPGQLRTQLLRLGAVELYHWLHQLHPVVAERCQFAFPPRWQLADMRPVLSPAQVAACLAPISEPHGDTP